MSIHPGQVMTSLATLLGGATASPNTTLAILGSKTVAIPAAGTVWNALDFQASTLTLAAGGVAPTLLSAVHFAAPTITQTAGVAYTIPAAATVTIDGPPAASAGGGASPTLSNPLALLIRGGRCEFRTSGSAMIAIGECVDSADWGGIGFTYPLSTLNYALIGNGSYTLFNVPGGGNLIFRIGNNVCFSCYPTLNTTFGGLADAPATRLGVLANMLVASAAGAVYDGIKFAASAVSITGSTAITTAGGFNFHTVQAPTITGDTATCVIDKASTLVVTGAPISGANITITLPLAVDIQAGNVRIASLGGTGTRNVVVDANGVLSAP